VEEGTASRRSLCRTEVWTSISIAISKRIFNETVSERLIIAVEVALDVSRFLIAGAGIGGLATARALQLAGARVDVYERATMLRPTGFVIALGSNAVRALQSLGIADAVLAKATIGRSYEIMDPKGRRLVMFPLAEVARRLGAPLVAVHRSDLQTALQESIAAETLHLGRTVVGALSETDGAKLRLDDGSQQRGDAIVGCDGLSSQVRAAVLGDHPPRSAGVTVWRGLSRGRRLVEEGVSCEFWGSGRLFLAFGLRDGFVYWAASIRHSLIGPATELPGLEGLKTLFDGWLPLVRDTIAATLSGQTLKTDLFDRAPSRVWGRGRITLLGDAAHPMTPHMGQGGGQALEDAVVLGRCVTECTNVETALRAYERARIKRANMFVRGSRAANDLAKLRSPSVCRIRDVLMRAVPDRLVLYRLSRMLVARL